ncbi:MAG: hypothetical protein WD601_09790, partial [Pseudohongiellaceae bacterium]
MSLTRQFLLLTVFGGPLLLGSHGSLAASSEVGEVIDEYCTKCHNFEDYAGGIDLQGLGPHNIEVAPDIGEKVIKRLRAGMMPPVGEPRPDVQTMQALAGALEDRIDDNVE